MTSSHDWMVVAFTLVVVCLLSNLQELVLPRQWREWNISFDRTEDRKLVRKLFDLIGPNIPLNDSEEHALTKLHKVSRQRFSVYTCPIGLEMLHGFICLPTLRELCVTELIVDGSWDNSAPSTTGKSSQPSNVQKIELLRSDVGSPEGADFLRRFPWLHTLHISHRSTHVRREWNAKDSLQAVIKFSHATLTNLSVTLYSTHCRVRSTIGSLKGLSNLETLELDLRLWLGESVDRHLQDPIPREYRKESCRAQWRCLFFLPNLHDLLPSSIRKVRLIAGSFREDIPILKGLLADFNVSTNSALPKLREVRVSRGRERIGNERSNRPLCRNADWTAVRKIIEAAGGLYDEAAKIDAGWVEIERNHAHQINESLLRIEWVSRTR